MGDNQDFGRVNLGSERCCFHIPGEEFHELNGHVTFHPESLCNYRVWPASELLQYTYSATVSDGLLYCEMTWYIPLYDN